MKTKIPVRDKKEADLIKRGLADKYVFAFVKVVGALSMVPTMQGKRRVLNFVKDYFREQDSQKQ